MQLRVVCGFAALHLLHGDAPAVAPTLPWRSLIRCDRHVAPGRRAALGLWQHGRSAAGRQEAAAAAALRPARRPAAATTECRAACGGSRGGSLGDAAGGQGGGCHPGRGRRPEATAVRSRQGGSPDGGAVGLRVPAALPPPRRRLALHPDGRRRPVKPRAALCQSAEIAHCRAGTPAKSQRGPRSIEPSARGPGRFAVEPEYREALLLADQRAAAACGLTDRPLLLQLAGHDPPVLAAAAALAAPHCDGVDLNLGCPQVGHNLSNSRRCTPTLAI